MADIAVTKVKVRKNKIKNNEKMRDILIEIRDKGFKLQMSIEDKEIPQKPDMLNMIKFTGGIFASLNDSGNMSKMLFPPIITDSGVILRLGIMAKQLTLFDKAFRPIFVGPLMKYPDYLKDETRLINSEKTIVDMLASKCKNSENVKQFQKILELIEDGIKTGNSEVIQIKM